MKHWTAMRPRRRILHALRRDRIAVRAARSAARETGNQPRLCRDMKGRAVGWLIACLGVVTMAAVSLGAHHSPVMFDRSTTKTLIGTVVEFAWTNPHSSIQLDVPNDKGGVDRWGVELGSPQSMARTGWRSSIIKPGDKVTVVVNPLKSGEFGGIFVSMTLPDGRKLGGRATD
jgi:uncharacterized protein DUF6152